MVEIRYDENCEVSRLAGFTVGEAREQFRKAMNIPASARAAVNGRNIKPGAELDVILKDEDKLSFNTHTNHSNRGVFLVSALLLALVLTGGIFAFGFMSASTTLNASIANANFADVSVNTTGIAALNWNVYGFAKSSIVPGLGGAPVFNIDTLASGYNGDLTVTVYLANTDELAKVYRSLVLKLALCNPDGSWVDINESGTADANDFTLLTLENSSVSLFENSTGNITTVRVLGGFYVANAKPFGSWQGSAAPGLYCEVAQR
jgi:hypothetical protein